jgi:CheY-like chemotaxis protein
MGGYEATKIIRALEQGHNLPIIALTAETIQGERERCIEAGMDDYITKPVVKATIESTVLKWLSKD